MLSFKIIVRIQQTSTEISLPVGEFTFGREPTNDLQIPDPRVSRRHGKFVVTANECQLVDLGSANGTFVNGEQLQPEVPAALSNHAEIKVGDAILELVETAVKEPTSIPADDSTRQKLKPAEPASVPVKAAEKEGTAPLPPEGKVETPAKPPSVPQPVEAKAESAKPSAPPVKPKAAKPPSPPPPPEPPVRESVGAPGGGEIPGLDRYSLRLIDYLPDIYSTDFMSRFLALFESIEVPIEWNIDNFDLYLTPTTAPEGFLPWLASWFGVPFDNTWSEDKRRLYLREAHLIYSRRGTRWALSRLLEIYTGVKPEILEFVEGKDPLYFKVRLPLKSTQVNSEVLQHLIDDHKPAHTTYEVEYAK